MASVRSRFLHFMIKHFVAPKFERAAGSIAELRRLDKFIIRYQHIPAGTEICPVQVSDIAAEWVRAPAVQTERAILYLHGGGLVMCSPATHRELAARLSACTNAAILSLDYRLAPEYPFPAAMHDTLAAYSWLLDEGYAACRLALGGDSAGGGLALQTLIYLRDNYMPLPSAAILLSPVTDWVNFDGESYSTRAGVDPLNTEQMCRFTAALYVGANDPKTPLLSPVTMNLSGLPALCLHVGDREVLLSDSIRLAERARAGGVTIEFKIWEEMWHVFQTSASFVPEARRSLEEIGLFIVNQLS